MKYIPAYVVIFTSLVLVVAITSRQGTLKKEHEIVQYNVPYIARNKIELSDSNQLVLIDARGNILIK